MTETKRPKVTLGYLYKNAQRRTADDDHVLRLSDGGLRRKSRRRHCARRRFDGDDDLGYDSTLPVTQDVMMPHVQAVAAARRMRGSSAICRT